MSTFLSEEQIERRVEIFTDALDSQLLAGTITQAEYDIEIAVLDKWASQQIYGQHRVSQ